MQALRQGYSEMTGESIETMYQGEVLETSAPPRAGSFSIRIIN